jgi:LacI family transcriptional regulator
MSRPVTLQDVADRAGVHRSTVTLALRDHTRLPVATRQRIKAIANELGYRMNPLVAALMQSRRRGRPVRQATLAFVSNYPTRYGWRPQHHDRPDFFPGATERASDFGYRLEHFWLAEPGMTPERFCDILTTRDVHGLLIGRLPPGQHSLNLAWERFSAVALGMTLSSPRLHHVTENHFDTAWQAMRQCLEHGYRRVGFVFTETNDSPRVNERWFGAYLQQQLEYRPEDRLPVCPGFPPNAAAFSEWFRREKPDALLVTHAVGICEWLASMGKRVPEDVGMVELQDDPAHEISRVYHDPAKIGALAVEMLVGLINRNETGVTADPHEVLLTGRWRDAGTLPPRNA